MAASIVTYRGVMVVEPTTQSGGTTMTTSFKELADRVGPVIMDTGIPVANDDSGNTAGNGWFYTWSKWLDTTNNGMYLCTDASISGAVWEPIGLGSGNQLQSKYATVQGTKGKTTNQNVITHGGGMFGDAGDVQKEEIIVGAEITHSGTGWSTLYLDDNYAQVPSLASNTLWGWRAELIGTSTGCTKSFECAMNGLLRNQSGTSSLLTFVSTTGYADDANFEFRAIADDTNDALAIQVRDSTGGGDTVRWGAAIYTVMEVSF